MTRLASFGIANPLYGSACTIFRSSSRERTCTGVSRPSRSFSAVSAFFTMAASAIAAEKATLPLVAMVFTSLKPQASKVFLRSSIVTAPWPPTLMPRRNATYSVIGGQHSTLPVLSIPASYPACFARCTMSPSAVPASHPRELLPINRKGQQHIPRHSAPLTVAGIHEQHPIDHRRAGHIYRTAVGGLVIHRYELSGSV